MKITANNIKINNILDYLGELWIVTKNPEHTKPGKGGAYVQVEVKNIKNGTKTIKRFSSTEEVEKAFINSKKMQYLYPELDYLVLMDLQNYEQSLFTKDLIGVHLPFLTDRMIVEVMFYNEKALKIKLPEKLIVEIYQTDPVIKSATITSSYKSAILTNGVKVMVPPYLTIGEKIVIKTEDLTFIERTKDG